MFIGTIILMLLLAFTACQSNITKNDRITPGTPNISFTIIQGKVHNIAHPKNPNQRFIHNKDVLIVRHRNACSDNTDSTDAMLVRFAPIKSSGVYSKLYTLPMAPDSTCFTALVVSYDPAINDPPLHVSDYIGFGGTDGNLGADLLNYDSLLAGPKKLGADFRSYFHSNTKASPPPDTVHIDFVVHDSTGN